MTIKKWLESRGKPKKTEEIHVDDLMILERWDEAETVLKQRLKRNPRDLQAHLKMAELCHRTGRPRDAVESWVHVADRYTADGHFDKAAAILTKAKKIAPEEPALHFKLQRAQRMRKLEHRLSAVMRTLSSQGERVGTTVTTSYLELRRVWGEFAMSDLVNRLDDEQLGRLIKVMELVKIGRDKVIVHAGEKREELFLLTRGRIEAEMVLPNGETTVIRNIEPGDVFGDQALLERQAWPATYRTAEPVVLLKLGRPALEEALQGNPDPRALLNALREQRLDAEVIAEVGKILRS